MQCAKCYHRLKYRVNTGGWRELGSDWGSLIRLPEDMTCKLHPQFHQQRMAFLLSINRTSKVKVNDKAWSIGEW